MPIPPEKRLRCHDKALHCFGTAYIFEKRASSIRTKVIILTFLGIASPATVGGIIGTFNLSPQNIKYAVTIAGGIGLFQLIMSIWALSSSWNDRLSYYIESKVSNYRIADEFGKLGKATDLTIEEFNEKLQILEQEEAFRSDLDNRHDISDKEKRAGMRAGLRAYQRPCAECKIVPSSMKGGSCGVCGD